MPKYLVKLSHSGGQTRLTIPRQLVDDIDWYDVKYVTVESYMGLALRIRRFDIDTKSKDSREGNLPGEDR